MSGLLADFRDGLRAVRRYPGYSAAVVLTLALGLGANAVIFALCWAALVQPVSFPDRERLLDVAATRAEAPDRRLPITPADFLAWRRARSFEHFGGYTALGSFDLTGDGEPERLEAHFVTAGYFPALGIEPLHGRVFEVGEEAPGSDRVVVLSGALWRRRFAADPGIAGRVVVLDGEPYTVLGVVPLWVGIRGGQPDVFVPLSFGDHRPADRESAYLGAVAKLLPGVSIARARAELEVIAARLDEHLPAADRGLRARLEPLSEVMVSGLRPTISALLAAVFIVLLIACVNVANLQLVRTLGRRREMAIRSCLGARRWPLVRRVLAESVVLGGLGGLGGLAVAAVGLGAIPDFHGHYLFRSIDLALNRSVLAATLGLGIAAGLASGAVAALRVARRDWVRGAPARTVGDLAARRMSGVLVVGQIGATFVLLVAAGLLIRSVGGLLEVDPGLDPRGVTAFDVAPPAARYPAAADLTRFYDGLLEQLTALPATRAAAAVNDAPGGGWSFRAAVEGQDPGVESPRARWLLVTPQYFRTAGIALLHGRGFTASDRAQSPRVTIINRSAARRLFPDGAETAALGRRIAFEGADSWHQVVGVVGDVRRDPLSEAGPACYFPHAQYATLLDQVGVRKMTVLVSSAAPSLPTIREVVRSLDPDLPIAALEPFAARLDRALFKIRLKTLLATLFAAVALALAAVGLYGVLAYAVGLRSREIGLRVALGARRGQILALILGQGGRLALLGLGLGGLLALLAARGLESLIHGVHPLDLPTWLAVVALLGAVALAASLIPARAAARLEPMEVLRGD